MMTTRDSSRQEEGKELLFCGEKRETIIQYGIISYSHYDSNLL
jgi:hypothetical protein